MKRRNALLGAAALGVGATVVAWELTRRSDRRRIEADPEWGVLHAALDGRPVTVRAADGTHLHARVFGPDGAPAVVLSHGWTESIAFWTRQIQALAGEFRVIAYDARGHGESAPAEGGDYSIDAFSDDLGAVLDATLRPGERAVVAGHSLGGMTIVGWAGRHPGDVSERIAAAALVATGMGDLISETLVVKTPEPLKGPLRPLSEAVLAVRGPLPGSPTPLVARLVKYATMGPAATPAQVAFCEEIILGSDSAARAATGRSLTRLELYDSIEHLTSPAVVLAGERDKLTPPRHAQRLADSLPELVELAVLPGAGHMLPVEAADEVTSRLRRLLRTYVEASSSPASARVSS
jgi:pimeloyl-ACP methyl ester carboxylesterase